MTADERDHRCCRLFRWRNTVNIEQLESRRLLAATLDSGLLTINGTKKNDVISIFIDPADKTKLDVKLDNAVTSFALSGVSAIFARGFAGDDRIVVSQAF